MSADEDPDYYRVFTAEYNWLRSFRMSDAAIARHFKCSGDVLMKRLQRAGLRSEALSPDAEVDAALQGFIAEGKPFDSWAFPLAADPELVKAAITVAVRRGLITRVGDRKGLKGKRGIYQRSRPSASAGGLIQVVA
ncbi:hypothetical protein D2E76_16025 [Mycobacteroides abscessus]|uniref:Uncharacterized protein n=1 Tax=Mycobacteroides abscessus TaxID=36809 RepID=A0ABD7HLU8_9MYCO|nr:hypothetical protein [Mycobacteroides abscessus]RIT36765.1 hypothetical protein D2E76_16025 [Mycobacteroides abscessus]